MISKLPTPLLQSREDTIFICDTAAGPAPAEVMSFVVRGGKKQKAGEVLYLGCIRDTNPIRCPQLGLGLHLIRTFILHRVRITTPRRLVV